LCEQIKWMAPEALRRKKFSEKSDVFSFGVTLWEMLSGCSPFQGCESMDVVVRVCNGERLAIPPGASRCLATRPAFCRGWLALDVCALQ
jgi:serine/threonine protein kinase